MTEPEEPLSRWLVPISALLILLALGVAVGFIANDRLRRAAVSQVPPPESDSLESNPPPNQQTDRETEKPLSATGLPEEKPKAPPVVVKSVPQQRPQASTGGGLQPGREYDITRKAELREGPGEGYAKRINQKASDVLKTILYMSVDNSVTVRLLQVKGTWSEVQITQPHWLAATHRGWIPVDCIQGGAASAKLEGWIKHRCRVYHAKSTTSKVVGYLASPASVGVSDDGSGWLRLIHGPIKVEGADRFLDNPDFEAGLYIEAANFTSEIPSKWGK